jgi:hypothetical protein
VLVADAGRADRPADTGGAAARDVLMVDRGVVNPAALVALELAPVDPTVDVVDDWLSAHGEALRQQLLSGS